jgi:hypothetical protein
MVARNFLDDIVMREGVLVADLVVSEASVIEAAVLLRQAADPVNDALCIASSVTGADGVATALDDVEFVLRHVMGGLAEVAADAACDADGIAATFDELDGTLSGDLP